MTQAQATARAEAEQQLAVDSALVVAAFEALRAELATARRVHVAALASVADGLERIAAEVRQMAREV